MGLSCGASCMKVLLIIFNVVFFLGGAAILAVGIWLTVDPDSAGILQVLPSSADPLWRGTTILLMAVGAATFVVGFFGCCGACKESPCMLGMYGSLLVIILIGEVVGGVLAAVFRNQIKDTLKNSMKSQVTNNTVVFMTYAEGSAANKAWHTMQVQLKCCGAEKYTDYADNSNFGPTEVPLSCCVLSNDDPKDPKPKDMDACMALSETDGVKMEGCYDAFFEFLSSRSIILIGIGIGIGILQILGIIFAFCLCRSIREGEKYA